MDDYLMLNNEYIVYMNHSKHCASSVSKAYD